MATGNVGNLNVKLTLSAEQFAAALVAAGGDVNQFAIQVDTAKGRLGQMNQSAKDTATGVSALTKEIKNYGVQSIALQNVSDAPKLFYLMRRNTEELVAASRAAGSSMQQAGGAATTFASRMTSLAPVLTATSYMAQDAASQLGTRGLGAALTAAANNIPALGLPWGGVGLAVASGISVAVQALGSYIDYTERSAKATKELKEAVDASFGNRLDALQSAAVSPVQFTRTLLDATAQGPDALRGMQQERRNTITDSRLQLEALEKERLASAETVTRNQAAIDKFARDVFQGDVASAEGSAAMKPFVELRNTAQKQLAEIAKREAALQSESKRAFDELQRINESLPFAEQDAINKAQQEAEKKRQAEQDAMRARMEGMKAATGIGAFGADTQQGFSMIQAALRTAKDVKNPQLDTIGTNTRKTADNTRDIAKNLRRIKVATIA